MGLQRVRHNWETNNFTLHFYSWKVFKCTTGGGGKSFSLLRQRRKITPQNPANLTVRSLILCNLLSLYLSLFFVFLQWSKKSKSNPSYRKQDSDGYKGSDLKQQSLFPPTSNICALQKTKVTGPQNTTARITKVHSFKGGWRQERQVRG